VFVVSLPSPGTVAGVAEHSAKALYDIFRASPTVVGPNKLNLEAATLVGADTLLLFQRGNISGVNSVIALSAAAFDAALTGAASPAPAMTVGQVTLPDFGGFHAGVSGATTVTVAGKESVLLSASYEATHNEIDDGDTLGSLVALVTTASLVSVAGAGAGVPLGPAGGADAAPPAVGVASAAITSADGSVYAGKVEGIAPLSVSAPDADGRIVIKCVAVTDSDGGPSELLLVDFTVPAAAVA